MNSNAHFDYVRHKYLITLISGRSVVNQIYKVSIIIVIIIITIIIISKNLDGIASKFYENGSNCQYLQR